MNLRRPPENLFLGLPSARTQEDFERRLEAIVEDLAGPLRARRMLYLHFLDPRWYQSPSLSPPNLLLAVQTIVAAMPFGRLPADDGHDWGAGAVAPLARSGTPRPTAGTGAG